MDPTQFLRTLHVHFLPPQLYTETSVNKNAINSLYAELSSSISLYMEPSSTICPFFLAYGLSNYFVIEEFCYILALFAWMGIR